MILFDNDLLAFTAEEQNVYLIVRQPGISMKQFGSFCDAIPRLKLTKFGAAKNALEMPTNKEVFIGYLRDEIELSISSDEMVAHVFLNISEAELDRIKENLPSKLIQMLKDEGITEGILMDVIEKELKVNEKIVVAEGTPATHGDDAVITYYEFGNKKPVITSDGKVNHYDLDLIDNVNKNEWIGKKIPATLGVEGITVKGNPVSPKSGRDYKLKFDPNTVIHHVSDSGEENLYAKINGAVKMKNSRIAVDNHLIINGDVEYTTGNIDFDGFVTVTGTVKDKFSVTATYDISINGTMGIGAVGLIESREGSVVIKGGVNGKTQARIVAKKDVFTKYSNEATIEAGRSIHVGLYALDSNLSAQKIILPENGRIIGGVAKAEHRIESGSIGNKFEKPTRIEVEGFERGNALEMLNFYKEKLEDQNKILNKLKRELEVFENNIKRLDDRAMTTYEYMLIKYDKMIMDINDLKNEIQKLEDILRTRGEGEVSILNSVFPKTFLEIKTMQRRIKDTMTGSFYAKDHELHHTT
ncbi:MAG: DUF342 domain-containing protein [Clostridia bacterium]|nr:DUF342 domain-containing protein [Clostridia bacterium]